MTTYAVLATGPSMSQDVADRVRHLRTVVVSDAFNLAPRADHLVSQDKAWWSANPAAFEFGGRKWSTNYIPDVERVPAGLIVTGSNSGLLALEVAKNHGATRILMLGFDMHGSHYFGPHAEPLKNTTPSRFEVFQEQFRRWGKSHPKIEVLNCNPASHLRCFPIVSLEDALC
jgi:hypothetical protein